MFSAGMLTFLAAKTAVRRRGLASASPPPPRAAIIISLIRRVKTLPRLESRAAFLCLIVAHLLCPDMGNLCFALSYENNKAETRPERHFNWRVRRPRMNVLALSPAVAVQALRRKRVRTNSLLSWAAAFLAGRRDDSF